jgi:hypothetical protein
VGKLAVPVNALHTPQRAHRALLDFALRRVPIGARM